MKAGITAAPRRRGSRASNGGRCTSRSVRSEMSTERHIRVPPSPGRRRNSAWRRRRAASTAARSGPWKPRTLASAISAPTQGPRPALRRCGPPARIARNVQHRGEGHRRGPSAAALARRLAGGSSPAARGSNSARPRRAAPGRRCGGRGSTSKPIISGMRRRDSSTARRCISRTCLGPYRLSRLPMVPALIASVGIAGDHRTGHRVAAGGHGELAELLRQRHRVDQRLHATHRILLGSPAAAQGRALATPSAGRWQGRQGTGAAAIPKTALLGANLRPGFGQSMREGRRVRPARRRRQHDRAGS